MDTPPTARTEKPQSALRLRVLAIGLALLLALGLAVPLSAAQTPETPPAEIAPEEVRGSDPGPGFPFLGVGPQAHLDPTRKAQYEDHVLNMQHYCTGCWCNNVFGDGLSESWNELVGKSETMEALWQEISRCIDPLRNDIPQIRTVPLESKYDDIALAKVTFYFSEFLELPLAVRLRINEPQAYLAELEERFGPGRNIDDTWHVWRRPGAVMLFDLYNVLRHDSPSGELLVVYTETFDAHMARVREVERITR